MVLGLGEHQVWFGLCRVTYICPSYPFYSLLVGVSTLQDVKMYAWVLGLLEIQYTLVNLNQGDPYGLARSHTSDIHICIDLSLEYRFGWIGRSLGKSQLYPLPRCAPLFLFSCCEERINHSTPFFPWESAPRYQIGWRGCSPPSPRLDAGLLR